MASELHRPADAPPPPPDAAIAFVERLLQRVRAGGVDEAWIVRNVRPPTAPTGLDATARAAWLTRLGPDSALGRFLRTEGTLGAALPGPTYQRVLLGPTPGPSAVVGAEDGRPVLIELAFTTCALCSEEARFVADLLDGVARRGHARGRLVPGLELDLGRAADGADQELFGLIQQRYTAASYLATTLRGASVCGEEGPRIDVCYADGRRDTWRIRWHEGRWRLDYASLADDSPLRVSPREAARWQAPSRGRSAALESFSPSFGPIGAVGVDIAYGAVDAWPDPRDGTVLVLLMDLDRVLTGLARIDPATAQVVDRFPISLVDDRAQLSLEDWASLWGGELTRDGERLAIHAPGRVFTVDVAGRPARLVFRGRASLVGWAADADGALRLMVGRPDSLLRYRDGVPVERVPAPAPPLAAWWRGTTGAAVCDDGTVVDLATGRSALSVCCGRVTDAAALRSSELLLATCGEPCDVAATLVDGGGATRDLPGAGAGLAGASISPDGAWLTTGSGSLDGAVLVWSVREGRPVARLPVGPVRRVRWSPDWAALVTIETDGRVGWWPLDGVLDAHRL